MNKKEKLTEIAGKVIRCRNCPLYKTATRSVPGVGNADSKMVFIGEAPGYYEDQQGLPFVGAAGKLLEQLLSSIGLKRNDVFICNILKHRPPENRDPLPEEVVACQSFLDEQIAVIDPKLIVALGRFAAGKFLPREYISRIHGTARYIEFAGKKRILVPLYHPAAALRNGGVMEQLKRDFGKIPQFLSWQEEEKKEESRLEPTEKEEDQMKLF